MSNVLYAHGITHFQLPHSLFVNGYAKQLSSAAIALFAFIHYRVHQQSRVSVLISATDLSEHLKMSGDTVSTARGKLEGLGLIALKRQSSGYIYTLTNAASGKPLVKSSKGNVRPFNLDDLTPDQLEKYFNQLASGLRHRKDGKLMMCCPNHSDSSPSLSVDLEKHGVWFCHPCNKGGKLIDFQMWVAASEGRDISRQEARAELEVVMKHLGIITNTTAQPTDIYPYRRADGELLFEVLRYSPKRFEQRRPDPDKPGHYLWNLDGVKRILYNLPEVEKADVVVVLEGEKDCDNFKLVGGDVAATTSSGGAGKWHLSSIKPLEGKRVVVVPDNNAVGRRHAESVMSTLQGTAKEVRLVNLPDGYLDMTDYLEAFGRKGLPDILGEDWFDRLVEI